MDDAVDAPCDVSITLLSLVPDAGHVIPLLRIAVQLQAAGVRVLLICPDESRHLAVQTGVPVETIGAIRPESYAQSLSSLINATDLWRRLHLMRQFEGRYNAAVQAAALRVLDRTVDAVRAFCPGLLITDDHLFKSVYQWIAAQCGIPLILNFSAGSSYRFLTAKPWQTETRRRIEVIRRAGKVIAWCSVRLERVFRSGAYREKRERGRFLQAQWDRLESTSKQPPAPTAHIAAGTIVLEEKYLADKISASSGVIRFPSLPPLVTAGVDAELTQWLDAEPTLPVVYVCFGTMAPTQFSFGERLIAACLKRRARILWAGAAPPTSRLDHDTRLVRWEKWVPQVAVLGHPAVSVFISHAGAGSLQEALWFGKPLICMPLLWDQAYNAWIVEKLNIGIRLDPKKLSSTSLEDALECALESAELRRCSASLSAEMRKLSAESELVDFIVQKALPAPYGDKVQAPGSGVSPALCKSALWK